MNDEFGGIVLEEQPDPAVRPAPVQAPTQRRDEFGGIIIDEPPKQSPQDKAVINSQANPEEAGKALGLAKRIPLPAGLIERDIPKYEQEVKRQDAVDVVQKNPDIAAWVDKKPQEAKAANDEMTALGDLIDGLKHFNSSVEKDVNQTYDRVIKDLQLAPSKFVAALVNNEAPDFKEQRQQMIDFGASEFEADRQARKMQMSKLVQDTIFAPMTILLAYPSAYFKETAGKYIETKTGLPSEVSETYFWTALAALGIGGSMMKTKEVPAQFRSPPGDIGEFVDTANLYNQRGKTTYQEMQEHLRPKVEPQKLLEGPGEPKVEGAPAEATVEPHVPTIDDTGKYSLQAGEVPRPGSGFVVDRAHVAQHTRDLEVFDTAFKKAQELKLRERSPEALQSALEEAVGNAKVFIPAETVARVYGNDEPHPEDKILGWASNAEQKIATSLATGADMQVPQAQFLAHADPALYDNIKDEISFRETGINREEMKDIQQKKPEDYEIETSANDAATELLQKLQPELFERVAHAAIEARGKHYTGTFHPDAVETAAKSLGTTTDKLMAEEGFKEGFITTDRRFISREEAAGIAKERGQVEEGAPTEERLSSDFLKTAEDIDYDALRAEPEKRKVKASADVGRIAALLGPSRYDKMAQMGHVTVKELFQNAFDAIKGVLEKGKVKKGKIDITVDSDTRTVAVHDNGTGMTPEVLGKQFIQIAGTVKETGQASGGFGIAKMLYAFNNTGMRVYTLRDGQMSILKTNGPELFETFSNPDKEIDIETRPASAEDKKMFPDGSGTRVEVDVPLEYKNPSDGEMNGIDIPDSIFYNKSIMKSPLFHNIDVKFNKRPVDIGSKFDADKFTQFANVDFNWGTARIYVSKSEIPALEYGDNLHVLSNGLWQFSQTIKANPAELYGKNVKREFYVDVNPKVAPEEAGYPFDLNRQQFSKAAKDDFEKIFAYISMRYAQEDLSTSATNFGSISYIGLEKGKAAETGKQVLQPPTPKKALPGTTIEGETVKVVDGKLIVKGREIPTITKQEMAQAKINLDELLVDQRLIDPNKVILHDNLMVSPSGDIPPGVSRLLEGLEGKEPELVSIVDAGRAQFGPRFDAYIYKIGQVFHELRNVTATLMNYPDLAKEAVGVSFDKEYYGVSIRVPFSGSFINPALARFDDPVQAGVGMIGTMIHELAHHIVRSHDAEFPAEMQTIQIKLDYAKYLTMNRLTNGPGYDLDAVKQDFIKFMETNHDIYLYLKKLATGPNTQTRGKRFKEAGAYETRDAGAPRDVEGAGTEGLRPALEGTGEQPAGGVPEKPPGETREARAVKRERKALYLRPMPFEKAKAAGVDETRLKKYSRLVKAQDEEENTKSLEAAKKIATQELSPEWKRNREEIQGEVETDLRSRPDIVADRYLRLGELPNGDRVTRIKLDEKAVKDLGGVGLDRYTAAKGGVNPDDIAPALQFASGTELINALNAYAKGMEASKKGPKGYFDQQVKDETDKRMQEKYGDLPAKVLDRARDMVTDKTHLDVLTEDLKILAELAGLPFNEKSLPADVKEKFQNADAQEVSYETFRRGAEKAGRNAENALLSGKYREAFQFKLRQYLAVLYAKEAKAFDKKMATGEKNFRKIVNNDSRGSIDQEAYDQAKQILHDIGFTAKPGQAPELTLQQFIDQNQGQVAVASWLSGEERHRPGIDYKNLTVGEWIGLNNTIRSIMNVGGQNKKVDSVHGKADLDNFAFDVLAELKRFGVKPPWESMSYRQRSGAPWRYVKAAHILVERMFDYSDKFDPNGPITRFIDRPLRDSFTKELVLQEQVVRRMKAMRKYVDNSINDYIDNKTIIDPRTEKPIPMTRQNLRYLMLHMGSESGIKKITDGFGIDRISAWDLVRKNANEKDMAWVNGMHELFDYLWQEGSEMQRRYTGVEADRIEARPYEIKTKDGKVLKATGGYAPVFYDKTRSNNAGDLFLKGDLFDPKYIASVPAHGYTVPRTNYVGWIDLNGTMMASKIQQQIHDIAFREAVRNAQKAITYKGDAQLGVPSFDMMFRKYWGDRYADLLHGWLRDIANVHAVDDSFAQGAAQVFSIIRQNITASLVAVNPGTVIKHGITATAMSLAQVKGAGLLGSAAEIGLKGLVRAMRDLSMSKAEPLTPEMNQALLDILRDENVREFIIASSPLFRNRSQQYPDTVRGAYDRISNSGVVQTLANVREKVMLLQRFPVALSDMVSAMPLWYTAYKEQMVKTGDHDEAVFQADRIVARAHGSSFIGDKPVVMRAGVGPQAQLVKSFVSLYNFWSHMANNMLQLGMDIEAYVKRGPGSEPGATSASIAQRIFLYAVVAIFAEEIAAPAASKDKHGGWAWHGFLATLRYFGGMIVGLREVTNAFASGYEPTVGMLGVMGQTLWRLGQDVYKYGAKNTLSKNAIVHLFSAIGIATGMGGPQVGRTVQGVERWKQERPQNFEEKKQLLRSGTIRR